MTRRFCIVASALVCLLASPAFASPTTCDNNGRCVQSASAQASHQGRAHQAHRGRHQGDRRRVKFEPRGEGLKSLIATINYKLARYVHPTGKCAGASEQLATYYWQGTRTATGEHYNPHGHSAASRTLPFGTMLSITNPHNGRSVTVRVNDRGPYTNAKLDLSLGAAQALGLKQSSYVCVSSL